MVGVERAEAPMTATAVAGAVSIFDMVCAVGAALVLAAVGVLETAGGATAVVLISSVAVGGKESVGAVVGALVVRASAAVGVLCGARAVAAAVETVVGIAVPAASVTEVASVTGAAFVTVAGDAEVGVLVAAVVAVADNTEMVSVRDSCPLGDVTLRVCVSVCAGQTSCAPVLITPTPLRETAVALSTRQRNVVQVPLLSVLLSALNSICGGSTLVEVAVGRKIGVDVAGTAVGVFVTAGSARHTSSNVTSGGGMACVIAPGPHDHPSIAPSVTGYTLAPICE